MRHSNVAALQNAPYSPCGGITCTTPSHQQRKRQQRKMKWQVASGVVAAQLKRAGSSQHNGRILWQVLEADEFDRY